MKKRVVSGIMLTLLLIGMLTWHLTFQPVKADPRDIWVDDDNTAGPWDGTQEHPYQNITSGLEHAAAGDTILVKEGTYYEHVVVDINDLTLWSYGAAAVIDGSGTGTIVNVVANNVEVKYFTIRNGETGIFVGSSNSCAIRGNRVTYNDVGIKLDHCAECTVLYYEGMHVSNNGVGIALGYCTDCTVSGNTVSSNSGGILLGYCTSCTVSGNTVSNNNVSILLSYSNNCGVTDNTAGDNLFGVLLDDCVECTLSYNTISNSEVYGLISDSVNCTVSYNTISNSWTGIRLWHGHIVYCNNFINNTRQVDASGANSWDNGRVGNYWSDYTGRDTDGDFIGETPYIINEYNKDNHPLMIPRPFPIECYCVFCIYGNIITYMFYPDTSGGISYYNISSGELTGPVTMSSETFHSLYENIIAFPCWGCATPNLGLYDIYTKSTTYLPYPYQFDIWDVKVWLQITRPGHVISMYGDIIALIDYEGVWAYDITTSGIIANLTTGPPTDRFGVSVHENIIAFSDGFICYHDLSTSITTNTTVPGIYPSVYGNIIAFQDGSTIKHYNISSGQVTTVGTGEVPSLHGNIIVFSTDETLVSEDLNDDGDMEDMVIRYYDMLTHTVTNTRRIGFWPSIYEDTIAFNIGESMVDADLNLDEDKDDYVVRYVYLHDVAVINVTPSAAEVLGGQAVNITIVARNEGTKYETFSVTAYYDDTLIETKTVTNLPPGEETTLTFTWNTTGVAKGNYTITAYANPVPGETDTTDNTLTDGWVVVTWLGDLDGDFDVDQFDFWAFCACFIDYYKTGTADPLCDFDDDGAIDQFDFWAFCSGFIDYYQTK